MCRQCTSGHHDHCLGIVYNHIMREFRKCGCEHNPKLSPFMKAKLAEQGQLGGLE